MPKCMGDRFTSSMPLEYLIRWAYNLSQPHIQNLPDWANDNINRYSIEAKALAAIDESTCKLMVQSMLATRFKMTAHREAKEMRAYALVQSKKGAKMREATRPTDIASINDAKFWSASNSAPAGVSMARLASALSGRPEIGAPVVDRTGLLGTYVFDLKYSSTEGDNLPTIWTALEEQLGLKLESIKTSVEVLVIDHIEKPVGN